jgi:hypothetical protein
MTSRTKNPQQCRKLNSEEPYRSFIEPGDLTDKTQALWKLEPQKRKTERITVP